MRGAESSKWFMSYEIYFELEYYYLRSNCNRWARSAHNNNLIDQNGTVLSLLMLPHLAFFALDCPPMHMYAFGMLLV